MQNLDLTIVVLSKDNPADVILTFQSVAYHFFGSNYLCDLIQLDASTSQLPSDIASLLPSNIRYQLIPQYGLGIFAAMNQALAASKSRFIWFLNSGDQITNLLPFDLFTSSLVNAPNSAILLTYDTIVNTNQPFLKATSSNILSLLIPFSGRFPCHQSCIFDLSLHRKIPYPLFYGADEFVIRGFLLRALLTSSTIENFNYPLCLYDITGLSSSSVTSPLCFLRRSLGYLQLFLFHRIISEFVKLLRFIALSLYLFLRHLNK